MCQNSTFWYYKHSEYDVPRNLTEGIRSIFLLHASLLRSTHLTTMGTFVSEETFFISLLHVLKNPQLIALFQTSFQKPSKEHFQIPGPRSGYLIVLMIASKSAFIRDQCVCLIKGSRAYGFVRWPEEVPFSKYLHQVQSALNYFIILCGRHISSFISALPGFQENDHRKNHQSLGEQYFNILYFYLPLKWTIL